jgi:hypothetical protein
MNIKMDELGDPLTRRRIETGWEVTMQVSLCQQFGFIDDPDHQFGNRTVWTRTPTQNDCLEPLLPLQIFIQWNLQWVIKTVLQLATVGWGRVRSVA